MNEANQDKSKAQGDNRSELLRLNRIFDRLESE